MTIHVRESVQQRAAQTFQQQFPIGAIVLDERSGLARTISLSERRESSRAQGHGLCLLLSRL